MAGILYKVEREQAKIDAPAHTLTYITLLEAIAKAAHELYLVTPHTYRPMVAWRAEELYNALAYVNFMQE